MFASALTECPNVKILGAFVLRISCFHVLTDNQSMCKCIFSVYTKFSNSIDIVSCIQVVVSLQETLIGQNHADHSAAGWQAVTPVSPVRPQQRA
jgi:hypothetical protein